MCAVCSSWGAMSPIPCRSDSSVMAQCLRVVSRQEPPSQNFNTSCQNRIPIVTNVANGEKITHLGRTASTLFSQTSLNKVKRCCQVEVSTEKTVQPCQLPDANPNVNIRALARRRVPLATVVFPQKTGYLHMIASADRFLGTITSVSKYDSSLCNEQTVPRHKRCRSSRAGLPGDHGEDNIHVWGLLQTSTSQPALSNGLALGVSFVVVEKRSRIQSLNNQRFSMSDCSHHSALQVLDGGIDAVTKPLPQ